jgi:hypothetical protein
MRLGMAFVLLLVLGNVHRAAANGIEPLVVIAVWDIDLATARTTERPAAQELSFSRELVDLLKSNGHVVHDRALESKYPAGDLTQVDVIESGLAVPGNASCQALRAKPEGTTYGMSALFAYEPYEDRSLRVVASPNMCCEIIRTVGLRSGKVFLQGVLFAADWADQSAQGFARVCAAKAIAVW